MQAPRSRAPARPLSILAIVLSLIVAACGERGPTEPPALRAPAFAAVPATTVCHAGPGGYRAMALNGHAAAGHRAHGDALPGELVPGLPGYRFGAACAPVAITDLTGSWVGTYDWDCGNGLAGEVPIQFVLADGGAATIAGTATYLGATTPLVGSYRILDPVFRADGTFLGGDPDAGGMFVRLEVAGAFGYFVNNEFYGTVAPDFMAIAGNTLNGDSPEATGCSAPTGYSGSFSIARVS